MHNCPVPIPTLKLCSQHWAIGASSTHRQKLAAISTKAALESYSDTAKDVQLLWNCYKVSMAGEE